MKIKKMENEFAKNILTDSKLKKIMSKKLFKKYLLRRSSYQNLDTDILDSLTKAIKKWAKKNGAKFFCHWFFPIFSKPAGKQIAFFNLKDSKAYYDLTTRDLLFTEADASSFPNGGSRKTSEARGYAIYDYLSPAFIQEFENEKVLFIPSSLFTYTGTSLDERTILRRSLIALDNESLKLLKFLKIDDVAHVNLMVGAEQEYFLIKTEDINSRLDLKLLNRIILDSEPLNSQKDSQHYYSEIPNNIQQFMTEVNQKLNSLGIVVKHQHSEVAPNQFELVPIYTEASMASLQNHLIMQVLSSTAKKYGLSAIFEEKPFKYFNGSGKHINWSLSTDTGINLFDPEIKDNLLFATFFIATISAVDRYNELLKISTSYRGNELRLGGNEAPPSEISIFTGENIIQFLIAILNSNSNSINNKYLETNTSFMPKIKKDNCDRNRTSPFAFCGNKFEFRMVGANQSTEFPITCLATMLAKILNEINEKLEKYTSNTREYLIQILKDEFLAHQKIIFNGNNYLKSQTYENNSGIFELYNSLTSQKLSNLFKDMQVMNDKEIEVRKNIFIDNYISTIITETNILIYILNKNIYPRYEKAKSAVSGDFYNEFLLESHKKMQFLTKKLEKYIQKIKSAENYAKKYRIIKTNILPIISKIQTLYEASNKYFPENVTLFNLCDNII